MWHGWNLIGIGSEADRRPFAVEVLSLFQNICNSDRRGKLVQGRHKRTCYFADVVR